MKSRARLFSLLKLLFIVVFVLVTGCKDKNSATPKDDPTRTEMASKDHIVGWPNPDSFLEGIPVYDTFEGIAPMFELDNDTTYVINFWATWCKPCIKELPYFEEFNDQTENEKIKVVLVSLDFPKQLENQLIPFLQKRKLSSKVVVLLDGKYNNWIDKVSPEWSGAIPATYIYKGNRNHLIPEPLESAKELSDVVQPFL